MRPGTSSAGFALAVGLVLLAAACGSGGDGNGADTGGETNVTRLLRYVPQSGDGVHFLVATDYDRAAEATGAQRPDGADAEETVDWLEQLTIAVDDEDGRVGAAAAVPGFVARQEVEQWRDEFGFSVLDTRASLSTGSPPDEVAIFAVGDSADGIDATVRADPIWGEALEERDGPGGPYYFWSDDGAMDLERGSAVRVLGIGGLMAVRDEIVVRGTLAQPFDQALDAGANGGSVLDLPAVAAVVGVLEQNDVHSFFLSDEVVEPDPLAISNDATDGAGVFQAALDRGDFGPGLEPYELLGAGIAVDDDQHLVVAAFAHDDEEQATTNVERLRSMIETGTSATARRAWADWLTVRSAGAVGNVSFVVLEVGDGSPRLWIDAFLTRDSLYWTF
jgi:hypothetical protein